MFIRMRTAAGPGGTRRRLELALVAALAVFLAAVPRSEAADGAYEPNDAIADATGPLLAGSTYDAAIERDGDKDLYFFYVATRSPSQVGLTFTNLGGSSATTDLRIMILDARGTPIAGQSYIRDDETRTVVATLEPQKYYVEVAGIEGSGDAYTLRPASGAGAFLPHAEIAARCGAATDAAAAARTAIDRAEAKLQRTTARLRGALHGTPAARKRARSAQSRARARLRSKRRMLAAATARKEPWCSIAP